MRLQSTTLVLLSLVGVMLVTSCGLRNRLPKFSRNSDEALYQDPYPSLSSVPPAPQTSSAQQVSTIQDGLNSTAASVSSTGQSLASAPAPGVSTPAMPAVPVTAQNTGLPQPNGSLNNANDRLAAMRQQYSSSGQQLNQQVANLSSIPTAPAGSATAPSLGSPSGLGAVGATTSSTSLPAPSNIVNPSALSGSTASLAPAAPLASSQAASPSDPSAAPNVAKLAVIYFQNGSSNLSRRDTLILKDVVQILKQKGGRLAVIGHASQDGKTSEEVNRKMSAKRAGVVVRYLMETLKVPKQLIIPQARGTANQVPGGADYNRRVELLLVSQ